MTAAFKGTPLTDTEFAILAQAIECELQLTRAATNPWGLQSVFNHYAERASAQAFAIATGSDQ